MLRELRISLALFVLLSLLTGLAYPMSVLGLGQTLFSDQANGSLVSYHNRTIGSSLIGQNYASDTYFHGRPSYAGNGYDAGNSSGSNLAPTSPDLLKAVRERVEALKANTNGNPMPIPSDLVTASGSGLDPHISVAAAILQVSRVAAARHMSIARVSRLVGEATEPRTFGILGESRVNLLQLNRALDEDALLNH
jgi:K+-transporting ATPase ATPase C chain